MALEYQTFPIQPLVKAHFVINCVVVAITLTVVILRMVSRFIASAKLGWDDYLILLSMPQGIGMLVIQGMYMPMGVGLPIAETVANLEIILKMMVSYALIYTFAISTIKMSVLFFYLRVFVGDRFRLVTKTITGFVGVYTVANILLLFLICRPFAANYDLSVEGNCGDQPTAFISIGAYNIISDVVILCLPIPMVWRLQAKREMKIGLTIIFLVGLVVSGVAVGRIFTLKALQLENITETMVWVDFLSTIEVNLGILCVSLPMLGPVLGRAMKRRGASKLSATPEGDRQFEYSRESRRKRTGDDTLCLDTIYGDENVNHDASVLAKQRAGEGSSQDDGSEVSLNGERDERQKSIVVQKQWSVSHT